MRAIGSRDTGLERRVRSLLWRTGLRGYRLSCDLLPGKPDLVFRKARVAVFVHGCFWHGHDCKRGRRLPKTNAAYWREKIERNKRRDQTVAREIAALGWKVAIVWECESDEAIISRIKLMI